MIIPDVALQYVPMSAHLFCVTYGVLTCLFIVVSCFVMKFFIPPFLSPVFYSSLLDIECRTLRILHFVFFTPFFKDYIYNMYSSAGLSLNTDATRILVS